MATQHHEVEDLPFPADSSPQSCHLQKSSDHSSTVGSIDGLQKLKYKGLVDDFVGLLLQIQSYGTEQRQVRRLIEDLSLL